MHDKTKDEETRNQVNNDINEYFNLDSLGLEDLNKQISEIPMNQENLENDE